MDARIAAAGFLGADGFALPVELREVVQPQAAAEPTREGIEPSRVSVMTVKTSDTCSSRRRSQLVCKRMPGADKPVRARQRVLAGVGAQP